MAITVLIADDHALFRQGVIELLQSVDNILVVAEAASGPEAIELASEHRPAVVIIDVEMPGNGLVQTMSSLAIASPDSRIIVLTMHDDSAVLLAAIQAGASAYLIKTADRSELTTAIRASRTNRDMVRISVSRSTLVQLADSPVVDNTLSKREHDIISLISEAKSNRAIGTLLNISEATVKRHLSNIYSKLEVNSRIEALREAEARKILPDRNLQS